jgi:hypothetical protein
MSERVEVTLEVPGLRIAFEGNPGLYEEAVRPLMESAARGVVARAGWVVGPEGPDPCVEPRDGGAIRGVAGSTASVEASAAASAAVDFRAASPRHAAPWERSGREAAETEAASPPSRSTPSPSSSSVSSVAPTPTPASATRGFDPTALYAALSADGNRRGEKDAVLLALVALAAAGKRDATPAEILAHLGTHGFPVKGLLPRPILAKLASRKGFAAPGLLPGTYRATPTGAAHVLRRTRGA